MNMGNMSGYRRPVHAEPHPHGGILVTNPESKCIVGIFDAGTPEGQARQIAQALASARDYGYQLGLKSVRDALGIK